MKKSPSAEPVNITKTMIDALTPPGSGRTEIRDKDPRGLVLRVTSNGAKSWCVFRRVKNGAPVRITIGDATVITPTVARIQAKKIIADLALGIAPPKKVAVKAKADIERDRKAHTLAALALAYVDFQQSRGRSSYTDARSIFNLHLIDRAPALANKPAADVQTEEITDLLRAVKESGKDRTANKLRSYLRAAYGVALAAGTSHEYPLAFKAFGIKRNPVAATQADKSADKADKNPLTLAELRAYWLTIENTPGRIGAALRFHLLTGGQRIEQLVSLKSSNVKPDAITLLDNKGRPNGQGPRMHPVPLTARAARELDAFALTGDLAITNDSDKPISAITLSRHAANQPHGIAGFEMKRVRSGVETLLAARQVSKEIRGRLQSHGVAGVQAKHYDAYEYMAEKLGALEVLESALTTTDAKVIAIRPNKKTAKP